MNGIESVESEMMSNFSEFVLPPEASKLIRRQFVTDYEAAGPKSAVDHLVHKGVCLTSRWSVVSELERMKRAVDSMPEILARRISSIWCDSNCGANYHVITKPNGGSPALVIAIAAAFKGNNGIEIEQEDELGKLVSIASLEPDWDESF